MEQRELQLPASSEDDRSPTRSYPSPGLGWKHLAISASYREDEVGCDYLRSPTPCVHPETAKNMPPAINTTYYRSKDYLNLCFITKSRWRGKVPLTTSSAGPAKNRGIAGPGWKYWRPVSTEFNPGCVSGRGIPNYIPEWELIQDDQGWFHVDDVERLYPITLSPDLQENHSVVRFVPYSFTPAERQPKGNEPQVPLNVNQLESYLGLLHSVPNDHRLHLGFEKSTLSLKAAAGTLDTHLENIKKLFDGWETFKVIDFDEFMNPTVYSQNVPQRQVCYKEWNIGGRPYLRAAMPSLLAELWAVVSDSPLPGTDVKILQENLAPIHKCEGRCGFALEPSLFGNNTHGIQSQEIVDYVSKMFLLHLNCHRRYTIYNHYKRRAPFHITWFRIMKDEELSVNANWKSGRLYGGTKEQKFEEVAFTVDYFFEQTLLSDWSLRVSPTSYGLFHWTTILLSPQHMHLSHENLHWPPSAILVLIQNALEDAANSCEDICSHFASVLNDQLAIFDLDEHDNLLFDDDTFSRSRCYFWVIDSLETFKERIADTKKQWEDFWAAREAIFKKHEEGHISRLKSFGIRDPFFAAENREQLVFPKIYLVDDVVKSIDIEVSRLDNSAQVLEGFYKKTQSLRDGLFSASAVAESRAATQLGENIRLLTYVSIFYLPLSYTASLWSINEQYTVPNLAIVTCFLAFTTYYLVSNLNHAVLLFKKTLRHIKNPVIDRMKKDPDRAWGDRGDRFSAFKPVRDKVEPSQWHIPQYLCIEILRQLRLLKPSPGKPGPEHENIKPYEAKPPPFSLGEPITELKRESNKSTQNGKQAISNGTIFSDHEELKQELEPRGGSISRFLGRRGNWLRKAKRLKTVRDDAEKEV